VNLSDLITLARIDLDDEAAPNRWSDEELEDAANEAVDEACRRARLLRDSTTTAICQIALTAGQTLAVLDPRVIRVERARIDGQVVPLSLKLMRDMDRCAAGWEDYENAIPTVAVVDYQSRVLRLVPGTEGVATLKLTVVRLPLAPLAADDDVPEIPAHVHRSLRHWIVYRCLMNPDSEKNNPKGAATAHALFEREFGKPQPIYDEVWVQNHDAGGDNGHY
jgi:hypothetical protein